MLQKKKKKNSLTLKKTLKIFSLAEVDPEIRNFSIRN